jgi:ferredoxin like protein
MKTAEKVALNAIKQDSKSHIELNEEECALCESKICLRACPAELYTFEETLEKVIVDHSGCLECGTCMIVCPAGTVYWRYPGAGFGIRYRYG